MDERSKAPLSHKRRSGSEARQKQRRFTFRLTAEEYALLENQAVQQGVTLGSYVRENLLHSPRIRQRRRPLADVKALAKTLGELNRVGGNINQVARAINMGDAPLAHDIREALSGIRHILAAIRAAMGLSAK